MHASLLTLLGVYTGGGGRDGQAASAEEPVGQRALARGPRTRHGERAGAHVLAEGEEGDGQTICASASEECIHREWLDLTDNDGAQNDE